MSDDPWSVGYDAAMEEASHEASVVQIRIDKAVKELKNSSGSLRLIAQSMTYYAHWKSVVDMMYRVADHQDEIIKILEEK